MNRETVSRATFRGDVPPRIWIVAGTLVIALATLVVFVLPRMQGSPGSTASLETDAAVTAVQSLEASSPSAALATSPAFVPLASSETARPSSSAPGTPAAPAGTGSPVDPALTRAIETALGDPRLQDYLSAHPFMPPVASEYRHSPQDIDRTPYIRVELRFQEPVHGFPFGTCDIYRESETILGIAWLTDIQGLAIKAVSPIWIGEIRCL